MAFACIRSVTVKFCPKELSQIKRYTEVDDESDAVRMAAQELSRVTQLRELKPPPEGRNRSGDVDEFFRP
jgi:hypothetical protein